MIRSKLFVTGLGLVLAASAAGAQVTTSTPDERAPRGARPEPGELRGRRGPGGPGGLGRADGLLFKGITLSADQKAKIDATREQFRPQYQALREQARTSVQNGRGASGAAARQPGQRPDSAQRAAMRKQLEAVRAQEQQIRDRELAAIRSELTQSQRRAFDENVAELARRMEERQARGGDRGGKLGRGDRESGRDGAGASLRGR